MVRIVESVLVEGNANTGVYWIKGYCDDQSSDELPEGCATGSQITDVSDGKTYYYSESSESWAVPE